MPTKRPASTKPDSADLSYVALLRGINVGGKNKLPMAGLVEIFEKCGATHVRTYIQSGNAVFRAAPSKFSAVADSVEAAILKRFSLRVPVVLLSADEWREAVERNPFLKAGVNSDHTYAAFLSSLPTAANVNKLDPNRSPGDAFQVIGRVIYMHLPNGVADSKLTNAYFDKTLNTISTARNWRTVLKLQEMLVDD